MSVIKYKDFKLFLYDDRYAINNICYPGLMDSKYTDKEKKKNNMFKPIFKDDIGAYRRVKKMFIHVLRKIQYYRMMNK